MKAHVEDFQLTLSYDGQSDEPYYKLLLSVQKVNVLQADAFFLGAQISEEDALKIIAHLEKAGVLGRAVEKAEATQAAQLSYGLTTTSGDVQLSTSLGWDRDTLKTLDGLRAVLNGDSAKKMDTLLGRLSGHRRDWNATVK